MSFGQNKYGSIEETFMSDAWYNGLLSAKGVPPADINFIVGDFTAQYLYPAVLGNGNRFGKFQVTDHPRITGIGLFCNLADGLVMNEAGGMTGPVLRIQAFRMNAANAQLGVTGTLGPDSSGQLEFRVPTLNFIYPVDYLVDVSLVVTTDDHIRIQSVPDVNAWNFATITIDPQFATRRIFFYPVFTIEHSVPMKNSAF